MATRPPPFSAGQLESLCKILAETSQGPTGSEIERLLAQVKVKDTDPAMTKWKRLYNALSARQNRDRSADRIFAFIRVALDPARYIGAQTVFEDRRTAVNAVLVLCGFEYRPDGKFAAVDRATTLSEAEARAHRLRASLSTRGVHPDVIASCRAELVQHNAFHAVLEASKSVGEKLRVRCGLQSDGAQLVDEALGGDSPRLRINAFTSDSDKSEHVGSQTLSKGSSGCSVIRRPTFHAPLGICGMRTHWISSPSHRMSIGALTTPAHERSGKGYRPVNHNTSSIGTVTAPRRSPAGR